MSKTITDAEREKRRRKDRSARLLNPATVAALVTLLTDEETTDLDEYASTGRTPQEFCQRTSDWLKNWLQRAGAGTA